MCVSRVFFANPIYLIFKKNLLFLKLYGTFGTSFVALVTVFLVLAIVSSFFPK